MLGVLLELMNPDALGRDGKLRLSRLRAAEIAGDAEWRWLGAAELSEMSKRLRNFAGITPVAAPAGLQATLRPYQAEGSTGCNSCANTGWRGFSRMTWASGKPCRHWRI